MCNARFLATTLLIAATLLSLNNRAVAQFGASIEGTVQDKSGAVVSGATVTVTNQNTGAAQATQSNAGGFYRISGLTPGQYTVAVEGANFKKSTTNNVTVEAERVRGLDVTLELGQAQETITVTEQNQALQTEDANVAGQLTASEVEKLPAINRDPYELLRLSPGVMGDGARYGDGRSVGFPNGPGANNGSAGPGGSNTAIFQVENQQPISANGQRITSNDYLVDGVSVNSLQWGGAQSSRRALNRCRRSPFWRMTMMHPMAAVPAHTLKLSPRPAPMISTVAPYSNTTAPDSTLTTSSAATIPAKVLPRP